MKHDITDPDHNLLNNNKLLLLIFFSQPQNQNGLREMSHSLGQGLDNAAVSFANVIIVIPNQWNQDPNCRDLIANKAVPWTRVHKADINIVPDHPVFGAQSYSFQYGACGQPGLPIQCPLTLITDDVTARGNSFDILLLENWSTIEVINI